MNATPKRLIQGPSYQPAGSVRLVSPTAPAQGHDALQVRRVISTFGTGTAPGQSTESAQLTAALLRLRADMAETLNHLRLSIESGAELNYNPVPVRPAFNVKATYKFVGKLTPRPFPIDE
jgi:hypothetical protein